MCLNPLKVPDQGFVACRECWQCKERKIDDWVGRNIAESKTATAAHVVTLTYGQDRQTGDTNHLRASVLTYSDVQKYLKLLRFNGYPVRYFVTGEYGSRKGRAHWHIILYWQGAVPEHKLRQHFMEKHWPHGYSYWDKMSPEAVRYACKYLLKDADSDAQSFGPMPSKKPPLGDAYFRQLAQKYVDAGLAPQDLFYSFPDVLRVPYGTRGKTQKDYRTNAKPVRFLMKGKTAENFLEYFGALWREKYNDEPPQSAAFWKHEDRKLRDYVDSVQLPRFERRGYVPVPKKPPAGGSKVYFDKAANCHYSDVDGVRLWYSYDTEGELAWHEKIRPDAANERLNQIRQGDLPQDYRQTTKGE